MSVLVLSLSAVLSPADLDAKETPNIIYILLDDAGYGDLSCYGQQRFETPNIDKMARQGMRFTQHYSGSTVCAPTRCVLMTGLHTGHCQVRGNREVQPEGQWPLAGSVKTMPEYLKEMGYVTGAFGKWGLGAPGSEGQPTAQGFDVFYGYNCQRQAHTYYPDHLWSNEEKVALDGKTYAHDLIMDQALEFIREHQKQPFFCFLPVTIPHAAMHVPEDYAKPFREKFPQFEDKIGKYRGPEVKNPIAAFAGMMTKLDDDVGEILELVDELGLDDQTVIMLSSDNGPHLEGGHDPRFFDSNGPFRGFKRDLYEGGIRAPLIVRWPGTVTAGTESAHVSAHWDMLATLGDIAGQPIAGTDGISFLPTLLGDDASQQRHDYLYWEFFEQGGRRAVRFGNWKAVQLNVHENADNPIELYDLEADPGEGNNVADKHPDLIKRAAQLFDEAHEENDHWKFRSFETK